MLDPVPLVMRGEGHYTMWSAMNIEVTEEFVGLGREVTKCQTEEDRVDCQSRTFRERVLSHCKCSPFSLRSYYGEEVILMITRYHFIFIYQTELCSPSELDCVDGIEDSQAGCVERCEGTIMDLEKLSDSVKNEAGLEPLIAAYESYKYPESSNLTYPDTMKSQSRVHVCRSKQLYFQASHSKAT